MQTNNENLTVRVQNLNSSIGENQLLANIDFSLFTGEVVTLIGKNGTGKSTLLRAIASLPKYDIQTVSGIIEQKARTAFVHQQYRSSLFPWLNAFDNIMLPFKVNNSKKIKKSEVSDVLNSLGFLDQFDLHKYPYQLSGGQCQMIAIARAFITKAEVILLDEPFSALDYSMQTIAVEKIRNFAKEKNLTLLTVLHDIQLSVAISDRCLFLKGKPATLVTEKKIKRNKMLTPDFIRSDIFHENVANVYQILGGGK